MKFNSFCCLFIFVQIYHISLLICDNFHESSFEITFLFNTRKSDSGMKEWGIVELQGDLEVRGNDLMENQFIGDLNYDKYGQPVCFY